MKHIPRFIWVIVGVTILVIGGVFLRLSQQPINQPEATSAPIPSVDVTQTPSPMPSPVVSGPSLQSLMNKKFDGRDFTVGRVLATEATYTRYYITYKSDDLTISGIMNVPSGTGPFPVLMLNHGYIDPAVYTNGRGLKREQDYLAKRGYVVIHSDYRNHAESSKDPDEDYNFRLGYIEDVVNGIYAVKAANLPYVNKDKIGMLGHSMGGGITLGILTTQPDLVNAAVLFAPVSASAKENFDQYTADNPDVAARVTALHGTPETKPEVWQNVSPQTFLTNIKTPLMVHHGTIDESTPLRWSDDLVKQLKELNKPVTYHTYPGEPHEFTTAWPTVMQRTVSFFDEKLK